MERLTPRIVVALALLCIPTAACLALLFPLIAEQRAVVGPASVIKTPNPAKVSWVDTPLALVMAGWPRWAGPLWLWWVVSCTLAAIAWVVNLRWNGTLPRFALLIAGIALAAPWFFALWMKVRFYPWFLY